jgi:hypothetical protein
MKSATPATGIVLVDDGELEDVVRVLEAGGLAFDRYRGGQIPERIEAPRELLIVTSRRLEHIAPVRARGTDPALPLRIVAVADDSPALRRRLRRHGMELLVRLPARRETWRLLIARALYQGDERRTDPRIATEVPIEVERGGALLVDLSNRGCRVQTRDALAVGDVVRFTIPASALPDSNAGPLGLSGRVRRVATLAGSDRRTCAVVFDADLSRPTRQRLTAVINHWASSTSMGTLAPAVEGPAIPACRLPSLPDLMLDDETDPPVRSGGEVAIELAAGADREDADPSERAGNRRSGPRGAFPSLLRATGDDRSLALVGRDLSAGGMRIERHPGLALGDRLRLSLHGPTLARPLSLEAAIVRDDAEQGLALAFLGVSREMAFELEKLVACLPDVESLTDGELGGLGTVLSEIVRDRS